MPTRPLYIDECLNHRLADWLRHRGRNAHAWKDLGFGTLGDQVVIPQVLESLGDDVVFVTADNALPQEHGGLVAKTKATLAIVAPYDCKRNPWQSYSGVGPQESWKRDIVQRWAHRMQEQERGSILRYSLRGPKAWTPSRSKPNRLRPPDEQSEAIAA